MAYNSTHTGTQIDAAVNTINMELPSVENELAAVENGLAYRETGTTASRNISDGEYVFWDGAMYKANGDIASGTTLESGTNLTPTENALNALSSKLYSSNGNDWTIVNVPAGSSGGAFTSIVSLNNLPGGLYLLVAPMIFASESGTGTRMASFNYTSPEGEKGVIAFEVGAFSGKYITTTAIMLANVVDNSNVTLSAKQYSGSTMPVHAILYALKL